MHTLRQKEAIELFEQAYQHNAQIMLFLNKATYQIINANLNALSFYGYPEEILHTMSFLDLCVTDPDDDPDLFIGLSGNVTQFSTTHRIASGQLKYMEIFVTPIQKDDQSLLLLNLIDNTERQQTEKRLRDTEARYRIIANYNHDWEYWITPDGLLGYISPSCKRIRTFASK